MIPQNEFSEQFTADMPTSDVAYSNSLKREKMNKPEVVQLSPFDEMRLLLHKSMDSSANYWRMRGQQDAIEALLHVWQGGKHKDKFELIEDIKQWIKDADKRWNDDTTQI